MNHQQMIRNLVVDGHLRYEDVLDLTPYQIAALLAEESTCPGEIDVDDWKRVMHG